MDDLQTELMQIEQEFQMAQQQLQFWSERARDLQGAARYLQGKLQQQAGIPAGPFVPIPASAGGSTLRGSVPGTAQQPNGAATEGSGS
jgi:hypothetical protein